jgi:phosphoglycerol geranylgeranyltransferase
LARVHDYIFERTKRKTLIFPLLDPDKLDDDAVNRVVALTNDELFDAYLVGGSTSVWQKRMEKTVNALKSKTDKPVIIFPNGIASLSANADAVLFMSLLNSSNPFYIIEQQVQAAPIIHDMGLETISTAYIILGEGGTAGFIGHARPIPLEKPELVLAYTLAAQYLGFETVYLETGSGVSQEVPEKVVDIVKRTVTPLLIVGGGIRTGSQLEAKIRAGADCIVAGNVFEGASQSKKFVEEVRVLEGVIFKNL